MPVGQKFVHKVDAELSGDAQFKEFSAIPSHALNIGSTVVFLPGVYEMGVANVDGIALKGEGDAGSVVLCNLILGSASANTVSISGLTLSGNSPAAASTSRSLFITNGSTATVNLDDVTFTNADFAVDNQSTGQLRLRFCDAMAVDRGVRSNAAVTIVEYTVFNNVSANAYFTGANATLKAVYTTASSGMGANTGNTIETIRALIS